MGTDVSSPRRAEIDAFLNQARLQVRVSPSGRGRLIFGLDATASRQETWDTACTLQAQMFEEAARVGSLDIQLVYYRGHKECSATRWISDAKTLAALMSKIEVRGGYTQIERVFNHALRESAQQKFQALVFVGDCVEETPADLYAAARELGIPVFLFQEGDDPHATKVFGKIARITRGAHCCFDSGSAEQLGELLRAVAAYAAGGLTALNRTTSSAAVKLLEQLRK
jgi:hypothetical protein